MSDDENRKKFRKDLQYLQQMERSFLKEQRRKPSGLWRAVTRPFRWVHWVLIGRRRTFSRMRELATAGPHLPIVERAGIIDYPNLFMSAKRPDDYVEYSLIDDDSN